MFLILETPALLVSWAVGKASRGMLVHATLVECSCVPWMLTGPFPGKLLFAPAADSAVADSFVGSTATAKFHWLFLGLFCPSHLVYLPLEEREIYRTPPWCPWRQKLIHLPQGLCLGSEQSFV